MAWMRRLRTEAMNAPGHRSSRYGSRAFIKRSNKTNRRREDKRAAEEGRDR